MTVFKEGLALMNAEKTGVNKCNNKYRKMSKKQHPGIFAAIVCLPAEHKIELK